MMKKPSILSRLGVHGTLMLLVIWSVLPFLWTFQTSIKFTRDVVQKEPVLWGYETTSNAYNAFWLDDDEINMYSVLWFIVAFAVVAALMGLLGRRATGERPKWLSYASTAALVVVGVATIRVVGIWLDERESLRPSDGVWTWALGLMPWIALIVWAARRYDQPKLLGALLAVPALLIIALLWSNSDQNDHWLLISFALALVGLMLVSRESTWPYFVSVGLVLFVGLWLFPRRFEVNDEYDFFINSIIVTVLTMIISISIGLLAGYGLARYTGISGAVILIVALGFRALPRTAFVLPYFFGAQKLGILDSRLVIVMALVAINQPFTIWMFRTFFMDVPKEMEEAAMMDGATRLQAFRKVIIPIMWPGIIATSLFTMLLAYNEFLFVRVLAPTNWTLPVAIVSLTGGESSRTITEAAAASVSITLPIVIVIILFQKHLVKGLGAGAVKG